MAAYSLPTVRRELQRLTTRVEAVAVSADRDPFAGRRSAGFRLFIAVEGPLNRALRDGHLPVRTAARRDLTPVVYVYLWDRDPTPEEHRLVDPAIVEMIAEARRRLETAWRPPKPGDIMPDFTDSAVTHIFLYHGIGRELPGAALDEPTSGPLLIAGNPPRWPVSLAEAYAIAGGHDGIYLAQEGFSSEQRVAIRSRGGVVESRRYKTPWVPVSEVERRLT
jgi:hypothetical protein